MRAPVYGQITAGVISASVAATTDPGTTPTGATYMVEERYTGVSATRRYHLAVPHDSPGGVLDLDTAPIVEALPNAVVFPSPGPTGPAPTLTVGSVTSGPAPDFDLTLLSPGAYEVDVVLQPGDPGAGSVDSVNGDLGPAVVLGLGDLDGVDVTGAAVGQVVAVSEVGPLGFGLADVASPIAQRTVPRVAELPRLMDDPPTITFTGVGLPTSAITSAVFLAASNVPYPGTPTGLSNNFTYLGGPVQWVDEYYAQPQQPTNDGPLSYRVPGWFYGAEIEFGYRGQGSLASRLSVNNNYAESVYTADVVQDGAPHLRRFDFGTAAWRYLEFECDAKFYGINIGPADTWIPARQPAQRLLVIGDSFGDGTGTQAAFTGYPQQFGRLLGFADTLSYSYGGTGLLAVNVGLSRPKYRDRAPDWAAAEPTAVLLQMSINDEPSTTTALVAELELVVAAVQAIPSVRHFWIMGPPSFSGADLASRLARDTAFAVAAATLDVPYVSLIQPYPLWTGTGDAGAPAGDGNCDVVVDADGFHPTQVGHDMIAYALALGVIDTLPGV